MNSLTLEKSTTPVTLPVSPAKLRCHAKVSLIMTALFLILAVVLHRWQTPLAERLDRLRRDYQVDLDLSRHKVERLRVYQSVHQSVDLPKAAILNTNEWIQQMQMMTAGDELSLKELKPVYERKGSGERVANLFLDLEGRAQDLLKLLYHVSEEDDMVYVSKFLVSSSSDGSDLLRAQITLGQMAS